MRAAYARFVCRCWPKIRGRARCLIATFSFAVSVFECEIACAIFACPSVCRATKSSQIFVEFPLISPAANPRRQLVARAFWRPTKGARARDGLTAEQRYQARSTRSGRARFGVVEGGMVRECTRPPQSVRQGLKPCKPPIARAPKRHDCVE